MASLKKRDGSYQIQYYVNGRQKRLTLGRVPAQIAREKLRQFESGRLRGIDNPLPSKTPVPKVLQSYSEHVRATKPPKSAQNDIYYLRQSFGPICDGLQDTSLKGNKPKSKLKKKEATATKAKKSPLLEARYFEQLTSTHIAEFIDSKIRIDGISPKTANHYRSILRRLFNWSMEQGGVRLPGDKNPATGVRPYKPRAQRISFLKLEEIDTQLEALEPYPQLRVMVATLIYAGLRRSELLWLKASDVDLKRRIISVQPQSDGEEQWQPKTGGSRAVPISSTLYEILKSYKRPESEGDWMFPSPEGVRWDPDNFGRSLRNANTNANLSWSSLDYRHTFGSQLAMKGESLYKISTLMGNSPEICRLHYAALLPESLTDSVEFPKPKK